MSTVENLTTTDASRRAVDDLSFEVHPGLLSALWSCPRRRSSPKAAVSGSSPVPAGPRRPELRSSPDELPTKEANQIADSRWVTSRGTLRETRLEPELWIERACEAARRDLTQTEWDLFVPGGDAPRLLTSPLMWTDAHGADGVR